MKNTLYIIVPCYNEETGLSNSAARLKDKLASLAAAGKASEKSRIVLVDDGSADATWRVIEELCAGSEVFCGIKLAANSGHQNALMAGLEFSRGRADLTISVDADLQDDIDAMDAMTDQYLAGSDIVCGVRRDRSSDSFLKRVTAEGYYRLMRALGAKIIFNHADYHLLSAAAVERLCSFSERGLFLRGLVPMLSGKLGTVEYVRTGRQYGKSQYSPVRMMTLAMDGLTSLSLKPLFLMLCAGAAAASAAFLALIVFLILSICGMKSGPFWLLFSSVWFIGGVLLAAVGLAGEYAGKALTEAKARPRHFIETVINDGGCEHDND
ncbi:MAG: glycosyltransferase family 2 protein [Oscillospiraceae bacterium]|nr:glycosyltransferase family 2 protein [Oscillospiraceae bacterium]